jgi:hypothetical protein
MVAQNESPVTFNPGSDSLRLNGLWIGSCPSIARFDEMGPYVTENIATYALPSFVLIGARRTHSFFDIPEKMTTTTDRRPSIITNQGVQILLLPNESNNSR